MAETKGPEEVDIHVGRMMRLRRKEIGMSQQKLSEHLGLTFQQVQKYEKAANRVSASVLYRAAHVLRVKIDYFFPDGQEAETVESSLMQMARDVLASPGGVDWLVAFSQVPRSLRPHILALARSLAEQVQEVA